MRVELRETGSIRVSARKDEVLAVLKRHVRGAAVRGDRVEAEGTSYVLRDMPEGTQVIHARHESAPVPLATRDRAALRQAVQADLFELARAFEVQRR